MTKKELEHPADTFSARDIFDPESTYSRIRSRYDPELKRRGLFYLWEARYPQAVRARWDDAVAAHPVNELVVFADDPGQVVKANIHPIFDPGTNRLLIDVLINDPDRKPLPGTKCRLFVLTPGAREQLCGRTDDPLRSESEVGREALRRVLEGSAPSPREAASILAGVADFEGEFRQLSIEPHEPHPMCRLRFELPSQASGFDDFPEDVWLLCIIEGSPGGAAS